jgi:hypothetical protein
MNIQNLVNGTLAKDPDLMRKIVNANDVTLTEAFLMMKRAKTIINFHTSNYVFGSVDNYDAVELAAAIIDLSSYCQIIVNKLNELK